MRRALAILLLTVVPAMAADRWMRLTTPEFDLYTTSGQKRAADTARLFEEVREFFLKASPLRSRGDAPLRIFLFDDAVEYRMFRPNGYAAAYYVATPASDYIVIGDRAQNNFGPAIHEYMHLIIRHSGLKLPTWLNEGWSDVFSTLRPMGKDAAVGDLLPDRMKTLMSEEWLDFNTLVSVDQKSPVFNEGARVGIFYAESWALAHMLFLSPEYKDNFGGFVTALSSGQNTAEAIQKAWGKTPDQVFKDLRGYFDRKRLTGVVFETRLAGSDEKFTTTPLADFDSRLALADLLVAISKRTEAESEYARLEAERPDRADLNQSIGNLALWKKDLQQARQYFAKAFDEGDADPRLCFDLAVLEREAKAPPAKVIPMLERALKSKPEFTEARVQLGLEQIDARDFSAAIETLMSIPKITQQEAPPVYCGLAYARTQTGDLEKAADAAKACQKWAKTEAEIARAQRVTKFVEARSKPSAAVQAGEKIQRVTGLARGVQCSPEGNRLQITVGNRMLAFDLPEMAAVEMPAVSATPLTIGCGQLPPVRIGVEFAPPRSAMETSVGTVRRLEY